MDSKPEGGASDHAAEPDLADPVQPRFTCRVVYLQATSEGPESIADHWQVEAEGPGKVVTYLTTSW